MVALVQQDAERRAEDENGHVRNVAARLQLIDDLTPFLQEEPGDVRDAEQEMLAGDLPGRARVGGVVQRDRDRSAAHHDIGRGDLLGKPEKPRQFQVGSDR